MTKLGTNRNKINPSVLSFYKEKQTKKILILVFLLIFLFLVVLLSLFVGSSGFSFGEVFLSLFGGGTESSRLIVYQIRMPRIAAAVIIGFGLAISGLIMQSTLRNPMASPSTLGVSNAAVFGANFAIIVLGGGVFHNSDGERLTISNPYLVTTFAFIFAILAVLLILGLSKIKGFSPETVVLAGLAAGSLFSAGTTIIQYFAIDSQLTNAVFWSFGDLSRVSYKETLIITIVVLLCFLVFFFLRWNFNALNISDDMAKSIGVHVQVIRFISLLLASLITAVCVSFAGIIGFIGLVAPQLIKRFIGSDIRFLLPASALTGSIILLISDTLSRVALNGTSLPVGAVTALFGAPIFIYILLRKKEY